MFLSKFFRLFLLLALLLFSTILVYGYVAIPNLLKSSIEREGYKNLGAKVVVGDIDFSIIHGEVFLDKIEVKNLDGFSKENLIQLENIFIKISPLSIIDDLVTVEELVVDSVEVNFESNENGLNFLSLKNKNLNMIDKLVHRKDLDKAESAESDNSTTKRFIIKDFEIRDLNISGDIEGVGKNSIHLKQIIIKNIGSDDRGLVASQLVKAMLDIITKRGIAYMQPLDKINNALAKTQSKLEKKVKNKLDKLMSKALGKNKDSGKVANSHNNNKSSANKVLADLSELRQDIDNNKSDSNEQNSQTDLQPQQGQKSATNPTTTNADQVLNKHYPAEQKTAMDLVIQNSLKPSSVSAKAEVGKHFVKTKRVSGVDLSELNKTQPAAIHEEVIETIRPQAIQTTKNTMPTALDKKTPPAQQNDHYDSAKQSAKLLPTLTSFKNKLITGLQKSDRQSKAQQNSRQHNRSIASADQQYASSSSDNKTNTLDTDEDEQRFELFISATE